MIFVNYEKKHCIKTLEKKKKKKKKTIKKKFKKKKKNTKKKNPKKKKKKKKKKKNTEYMIFKEINLFLSFILIKDACKLYLLLL
jgi:hypothetical protein